MYNELAIPEWRQYFFHKCNKVGHECKESSQAQGGAVDKETRKSKLEKKMGPGENNQGIE